MEIKIDSEMVNKVVAESIIKSALGKGLEDAINKQMSEMISGYSSPVKNLIQQHVTDAIKEVLNTSYKAKIIELIAAQLTGEHVDSIVSASVSKALDMLRNERY